MPIDDIISGAKPAHEEVSICLRQDLQFHITNLESEFLQMTGMVATSSDERLAKKPISEEAKRVREERDRIAQEMIDNTITFHIDGISTNEYNGLQTKAGKPRSDDTEDKKVGFNLFEFYKLALVRCTTKIVSNDGDEKELDNELWDKLQPKINDAQFDELCAAVTKVNRRATRNPTMGRNSDLPLSSTQR